MLLRILPTCYQQHLQNAWQLSTFSLLQNQTKNKHQYILQKWEIFGRKMCLIFTVSLKTRAYFLHAFVILWGEKPLYLSYCMEIHCVVVVCRLLNYWLKVSDLWTVVYSNLVRLIVVVAMERWQTSLGAKENERKRVDRHLSQWAAAYLHIVRLTWRPFTSRG